MKTRECLSAFAKFIETELGIIYSEHNYFQLQNRLEEIARVAGLKQIEDLTELLRTGKFLQYKQLLLDLSTNNETSFFRDPKMYAALEQILQQKKDLKKLNIWSAACSSGQEAISLAILIKEHCEKSKTNIDFSILATDICESVLKKSSDGIYSQLEVDRGLSEHYLSKYFTKNEANKWSVNPEIRKHITFQKLNLINDFSFNNSFDLVLCRNVLIYQNIKSKTEIVKKISNTLTPTGILILGAGESLLGISEDYSQNLIGGAVIYFKKSTQQ